jgi:hypothetical protein
MGNVNREANISGRQSSPQKAVIGGEWGSELSVGDPGSLDRCLKNFFKSVAYGSILTFLL